MVQHIGQQDRAKHGYILVRGLAMVVLLLSILGCTDISGNSNSSSSSPLGPIPTNSQTPGSALLIPGHQPPKNVHVPAGSVSPLLFGTNLSLYDSNDQVLQSAATRTALANMHFRIIRMPVRPTLSNVVEIQAAQAIKSIGAYALVSLRGAVDANVLADDTRIINDMNSVYDQTVVFYEYGNEEDLLGVNVANYTASWNAIVPQLKRIALNGHFIGPVNYHYDLAYLTTFLQQANPRPDEISWHEYTCDDASDNTTCIANINSWTTHINDARNAMLATLHTALPIMITEWNYAPMPKTMMGKLMIAIL